MEKAQAVAAMALNLLAQVVDDWNLNHDEASKLLAWAARLYSVGLDIAHNDYHKHSAYVVQHVDLAGCSRVEQTHLAALVLAHRKRFPLKQFPPGNDDLIHLAMLLRLAVIFHRGKKNKGLPTITLAVAKKKLRLKISATWLDQHPLTHADLETEMRHLDDIGYSLELI
jgi:exopolyphosphatase/guanosine-5'-triphosphate,3'-diphosphate pyrophosphatase